MSDFEAFLLASSYIDNVRMPFNNQNNNSTY
jgi:hypothetical protein